MSSAHFAPPDSLMPAPILHVRPLAIAVAASVVLFACADRGAPLPEGVVPASVTVEQFAGLRWFEGRWSGVMPDSSLFYEAYRVVDDSTIRSYSFADSAAVEPNDSGTIMLRGDRVTSGDSLPRWVATRIDETTVRFESMRNAGSAFEWTRTGPGLWTARLQWDSSGVARERTYRMVGRP
jgi:hypothetical protein